MALWLHAYRESIKYRRPWWNGILFLHLTMWGLFTVKAGAGGRGPHVHDIVESHQQQTAHVMLSWTSISEERERDSSRSSSILSTQTPDTPPLPLHPFPLPHIPSARNMTKLSPICIQACLCLFFLCENFFQRIFSPTQSREGGGRS